MIVAQFKSVFTTDDRAYGPTSSFVLTQADIRCDGDPAPVASFDAKSCMWRVGSLVYTSVAIVPVVNVTFSGGLTAGPISKLRIVAQYLYDGDKMIARMLNGNWYAYEDGKVYKDICLKGVER